MKVRLIVLVILFFGWMFNVHADESKLPFYFSHLTNNDGLSSSHVNCIYEDTDGFMWFGTEDGLNLFDGISIRVFKNIPNDSTSLCNNSVYSMVNDPGTGNLWIGTRRGICIFDKTTFSFVPMFEQTGTFSIGDHIIVDLKFDNDGILWMATSNGLFTYNPDSKKLIRFVHDGNNSGSIVSSYINHILIDSNQQILISTRSGIDLFDAKKQTFTHLFVSDSLRNVMQIFKDSFGKYWICTDDMGVYNATFNNTFQLEQFRTKNDLTLHTSRIHSVLEDNFGNILLMARDKGIFYYNHDTNNISFVEPDIFDSQSLNSKALISSFKSSSGIIWLGTFNHGINYLDDNRKLFHHYKINYKPDGLFNNNVRSFFQDSEGNIWVGTKEAGGLSLFHPNAGTFQNFKYETGKKNSFSNDYILAINELNNDVLIIGTLGAGVDLFNKKTHMVTNLKINDDVTDNKVYNIYKDWSGTFWIASLEGLFQLNPTTQKFRQVENVRAVKTFAQNNDKGIWMGTRYNGLLYYSFKSEDHFVALPELQSLVGNEITALRFANDTILWMGTTSGLVAYNTQTKKLTSWSETDGLSGSRISSIEIANDGNIWISTSNGLSRFNPTTHIFKNYSVEDGLQGNDFEMYTSLKAADGKLFFGGSNGFNVFDPKMIKDNLLIPQIHFTDFKIDNRSVPIQDKGSSISKHIDRTDHLLLNHKQTDFTFEFAALNFTSPENNHFQYKLEGYDEDWVQAGKNRMATYTNIGAGNYVFRVIGSNNDNIWNNEGRSIQITILPPPWKSKWAYMFYMVFIGLMVMGFYFIIVKRIEEQNLLRAERQEREKMELINQLKLRFFTNISHEFRTPLTLISSPLSKLMKNENMNQAEQRYLYSTMHKNVKRLLRLMKQLMDFRKLEDQQLQLKVTNGNLPEFVHEITRGFKEFAGNNDIEIDFTSTTDKSESTQWFDANVIDNVIFNLLSNALKFSPRNSKIDVKVNIENNWAKITIVDQGVGIPADKIDKIFERFYSENHGIDSVSGTGIGLSFTKNLITLHKGEIHVKSSPGIETSFEVQFPINKQSYSAEEIAGKEVQAVSSNIEAGNSQPNNEPGHVAATASKKQWSVLIVEDNLELRKFLKNQLSGYTVSEAGNGIEALELAQKLVPDVIISDVMMPEMDGVQLCSAIKSDFITSHIPVILLTARTANEHKIEGMESGADAYVEKPFDMAVLDAQVRNLIAQRNRLRKRFSNQFEISPSEISLNTTDQKFFEKAEKIVADNISSLTFSVEDFGAALSMSRSQLFRKFKAITDNTPSDYIRAERIKLAKKLLLEGEFNVNEISFKTGFNSSSHFISTFKKYTGFTPREFIQNKP